MSRIGNTPIAIPSTITLQIAESVVTVNGPKGVQHVKIPNGVHINFNNNIVKVEVSGSTPVLRANHGVARALLANAVTGVLTGWTKSLELVGVGYRATIVGTNLQLTVGYSHPVIVTPPEGITFQVVEGKIIVSGIDKQLVGEISAQIREVRKPEPYKGKGIRYVGEYVRRKAGKAAKAIGGAPGAK